MEVIRVGEVGHHAHPGAHHRPEGWLRGAEPFLVERERTPARRERRQRAGRKARSEGERVCEADAMEVSPAPRRRVVTRERPQARHRARRAGADGRGPRGGIREPG